METEILSVSSLQSPVSSLHIRKQHNDNDRCLGFGPALFELSLSLSSGDGPEASGEMINILKLFLQLNFIVPLCQPSIPPVSSSIFTSQSAMGSTNQSATASKLRLDCR